MAFQDPNQEFKNKQMEYQRVKMAYIDKEKLLEAQMAAKNIFTLGNQIYIRVHKREQEMELWVKPLAASKFQLFKTYKLCSNSGDIGPKKTLADQKIPEGMYEINRFSPEDVHMLALGLNYPNKADLLRKSEAANIEVRGGCKSSGSMPLGDDLIKEIYVLVLEAYSIGQKKIPVHVFPTRMAGDSFARLATEYAFDKEKMRFWNNIKTCYEFFESHRFLPEMEISEEGNYIFMEGGVPIMGHTAPIVLSGNPTPTPAPTPAPSQPTPAPAPADSGEGYHIVLPGETLYGISNLYQRSLYNVRRWNGLKGDIIEVGQRLRIAPPDHYEVKKGDTLYSIATKHGLTVSELKALNNRSRETVVPGEKLITAQP
jgi:murein L,D-transpeptidase YafK